MSHTLRMSAAAVAKSGFLTIKDTETIKAADVLAKVCQHLKLAPPKYDANMSIAGQRAPGYAIRLPGWYKPVSVNTDTGELAFDNYSAYDANHPEVIAGTKRIGEAGLWGSIDELDNFQREYERQLNLHLQDNQLEIARQYGHHAQVIESGPDRIVLEVYA